VIDYVMVNERIGNRISRFRIGERVDLDHMPMELTVEITRKEDTGARRKENEGDRKVHMDLRS